MKSELSQKKQRLKCLQVLRWLGIIPGAFLCTLLVMFPIHWVVMLIQLFGRSREGDFISIDGKNPLAAIPPEMLERFGYALFTPFVIIIVGAKIAPKFKFPTGIALAVLWGVLFGAAISLAISKGQYEGWGWLRFAITCVLGIAGVGLGLFNVHKAGEIE